MDDTISRQDAIDALKGLPTWWADEGGYYGGAQPPMVALLDPEDAVSAIENLPSAQPERLTDDDFETIRIHLSAYKERLCNQHRWKEAEEYQRIIDRFMSFASAQPDIIVCADCKHWICHDRRCGYWNHGVKPLEWCCHAERKTDE